MIVWAIGGSDSGGGAGIQADLKTINGLGAYGCSVLTAITAQNSQTVTSVLPVPLETIDQQFKALAADLAPRAVKTGMLWSGECVSLTADWIKRLKQQQDETFVVCDPVMVATSGDALQSDDIASAISKHLIADADLITPNIIEAHALCKQDLAEFERLQAAASKGIPGSPPSAFADDSKPLQSAPAALPESENSPAQAEVDSYIENLARKLIDSGAKSVLIKGGHRGGTYSQDFYCGEQESFWISAARIGRKERHGTGCTLASAIASCVALGYSVGDALIVARAYLNQGLRQAPAVGRGNGPLAHLGFPDQPLDTPWVTQSAEAGRSRPAFPSIEEPIGFYPIINSLEWVERLAPIVKSMQLRIKADQTDSQTSGAETGQEQASLSGRKSKQIPPAPSESRLEDTIARAIAVGRDHGCRLFINDHWKIAIKYGAYGIHLGQSDLKSADLSAIQQSGCRLGVSTHTYEEVARAVALRPSYIAVGPMFPTTTKDMPFAPYGFEGLKRWRRNIAGPLVAIGGIELSIAKEVIATGVDGIAVVRDITESAAPESRARQWCNAWNLFSGAIPKARATEQNASPEPVVSSS